MGFVPTKKMNKLLLKLVLSVDKTAGIKPSEIARNMMKNRTRGYALELHYELGKPVDGVD